MLNEIRWILEHDAQAFWSVISVLIFSIGIVFIPPLIFQEIGYLRVLKFWIASLLLAVIIIFIALVAYTLLFYNIPQTGG